MRTLAGAILIAALSLAAACASFPPRNADGTLNITALINDAAYGIEADCALGFNIDVCRFGRDTVDAARAVQTKDPPGIYRAVRRSLVESSMRWPTIAPYVQWLIQLLATYAPPLGT